MGTLSPLRILHISDLHFTSGGAPLLDDVDRKMDVPDTASAFQRSAATDFLRELRTLLLRIGTEDHWPKAVIVTGDLVDRGGTDGDGAQNEYRLATEFLGELANLLALPHSRIYIVPGNHDIDWSAGLTQEQRFKRFFAATKGFTTPQMLQGVLNAERVDLRFIRDDIPVELTLLASPTFSGIVDPSNRAILEKISSVVNELPVEHQARIRSAIASSAGLLDIAAIGNRQLDQLQLPIVNNPDEMIRTAVLHHHLLPHPIVEITPFEAVLDAGKVLERLIRYQYDLVLNGHKHIRRLVQYSYKEKSLALYTAPSLFSGNGGFTIIEFNGPNEPSFATLRHFNMNCEELNSEDLVRNARVDPEVVKLATQIIPAVQRDILIPVLRSMRDAMAMPDVFRDKEILKSAWRDILDDIRNIGEQVLVFRPPHIWDNWEKLIKSLGKDASIRLVSANDLGYWREALVDLTEASRYAAPLREFEGEKTRILVWKDSLLATEEMAEEAATVINVMIEHGFRVLIVPQNLVDDQTETDFGLIGEVAVSTFIGKEGSSRGLQESFNARDIAIYKQHWQTLYALARWDSKRATPLKDWLRLTFRRSGHKNSP